MPTYGGAVTRTAEGRWTAHGTVTHPDGTRTRSTSTTDGTSRAVVWAELASDLRAIATSATSTTSTTTR